MGVCSDSHILPRPISSKIVSSLYAISQPPPPLLLLAFFIMFTSPNSLLLSLPVYVGMKEQREKASEREEREEGRKRDEIVDRNEETKKNRHEKS